MPRFKELSRVPIGGNKYLVFSENEDGNISMAQMIMVEYDDKAIPMFLKNAAIFEPKYLEDIKLTIEEIFQKI